MEVCEEATHNPTPATARCEMWPGAAGQSSEIIEPLICSWKCKGSYVYAVLYPLDTSAATVKLLRTLLVQASRSITSLPTLASIACWIGA